MRAIGYTASLILTTVIFIAAAAIVVASTVTFIQSSSRVSMDLVKDFTVLKVKGVAEEFTGVYRVGDTVPINAIHLALSNIAGHYAVVALVGRYIDGSTVDLLSLAEGLGGVLSVVGGNVGTAPSWARGLGVQRIIRISPHTTADVYIATPEPLPPEIYACTSAGCARLPLARYANAPSSNITNWVIAYVDNNRVALRPPNASIMVGMPSTLDGETCLVQFFADVANNTLYGHCCPEVLGAPAGQEFSECDIACGGCRRFTYFPYSSRIGLSLPINALLDYVSQSSGFSFHVSRYEDAYVLGLLDLSGGQQVYYHLPSSVSSLPVYEGRLRVYTNISVTVEGVATVDDMARTAPAPLERVTTLTGSVMIPLNELDKKWYLLVKVRLNVDSDIRLVHKCGDVAFLADYSSGAEGKTPMVLSIRARLADGSVKGLTLLIDGSSGVSGDGIPLLIDLPRGTEEVVFSYTVYSLGPSSPESCTSECGSVSGPSYPGYGILVEVVPSSFVSG